MSDFVNPSGKDVSEFRILVTNDDGIHAQGLQILEDIARELTDDVWVVAPETEQSGAGHSLTLHQPLRIREVESQRYAVSGTPTDSALLGIKHIITDRTPDLLLSGVNFGANLGEDVTYSGTIAAAMEGTLLGVPSIALSQVATEEAPFWETTRQHAPDLLRKLLKTRWPEGTLINLNFPGCEAEEVKGIRCAPQGRRKIGDRLDERLDPKGRPYVWIGSDRDERQDHPGSDIGMIRENFITVTPLNLDLTDYKELELIRETLQITD